MTEKIFKNLQVIKQEEWRYKFCGNRIQEGCARRRVEIHASSRVIHETIKVQPP